MFQGKCPYLWNFGRVNFKIRPQFFGNKCHPLWFEMWSCLSLQNKLAFWAGCREEGDEIHLYWGQIWVISLAVTLNTYFQVCILLSRFAKGIWKHKLYHDTNCTHLKGVAPKLWWTEIKKRLWIGIFHVFIIHINVP